MKNPKKTQAIRLIEKFDKQLRDILNEELKSVRAVKNHIIGKLTNDDLLVA